MKTTLVLILLVGSLGCLAAKRKADFEANLNSWVGRPATEFIQAQGEPILTTPRPQGGFTHVFTNGRRQEQFQVNYREYTNLSTGQRVEQSPQSTPPDWAMNPSQTVRVIDRPVTMTTNLYCRLILETDAKGTILSTRYEGNDCW